MRASFNEIIAHTRAVRRPGTVEFNDRCGADVAIVSDPALRQVIGNVLDNAAEVSPDWTSFTTSRDGDMQVKSAVLLAGLYAHGETHVHEPHPTRDYSERMLQALDRTSVV